MVGSCGKLDFTSCLVLAAINQKKASQSDDIIPSAMLPRYNVIRSGLVIILLITFTLGAALRLFFVLQADFPINDGGLFYQMTNDLLANHFTLPVATRYNSGSYSTPIPFTYAPLGFYLAGLLKTVSGLELITIFQYLPVVYTILAIPVYYLLACELLGKGPTALYSMAVFAALLPAYQWLVMGGGVTRSPAMLFSILALWQAARAFKRHDRLAVLFSAIFTGLTGLTHLEIFLITAIWIALMAGFLALNRWGLLALLAIGFGSALVVAPWFLTILSRHGLSTLLGALSSSGFDLIGTIAILLVRNLTDEVTFTPFLVLGMLAFVQRILRREYLLPAWVLAVVLFDHRGSTRSTTIPLAMLAGIAIDEIILPAFQKISSRKGSYGNATNLAIAGLIAFLIIRSAIYSPLYAKTETNSYDVLSRENRQSMQWVKSNTLPGSRFLVLGPYSHWSADQAAEWFPALTERPSLNTPQGAEWLSPGSFSRQVNVYESLRTCTGEDLACLDKEAKQLSLSYDYIYISGESQVAGRPYFLPLPIETALQASPAYKQVYQNGTVSIYERK